MSGQGAAAKRQPTHCLSQKDPQNQNNWMMRTQVTVQPLHKGAKREDREGLCPSGGEACLQTKENSKRELMQVKNRNPELKQTGVVYDFLCHDCPDVYVGETKMTLKVRLSEHRQAVK